MTKKIKCKRRKCEEEATHFLRNRVGRLNVYCDFHYNQLMRFRKKINKTRIENRKN